MTQDDWKRGYNLEQVLNYEADDFTHQRVIARVIRILCQHPFILRDCPRIMNDDTFDPECPYYIKAPLFMDCSLIANFFGPFSAEEISKLMEQDQKEIQRLVSSGMKKLRERLKKEDMI